MCYTTKMEVVILQWNVWNREDPANIVACVQRTGADIFCAQELIRDSRRGLDTARFIANGLGFAHFFIHADTWDRWDCPEAQGNAIFSRYPILRTAHVYVTEPRHNPDVAMDEGRVYVEADIRIGASVLTVGTTHLSFTPRFEMNEARRRQADALVDIVKKKKHLYVFTGDLNAASDSYPIQRISEHLLNAGPAFSEKTWTTKPFSYQGFSEDRLDWRIDYIFTTPDVAVANAEIIQTAYSDHLPIRAKILLSS